MAVSKDNIEKRLRSEIMLFVLCLKVGVAEMSREKDVHLGKQIDRGAISNTINKAFFADILRWYLTSMAFIFSFSFDQSNES